MFDTVVAVVLAVLPTVVAVALFVGIGTLIVRGDLVAETIRNGMRPPKTAGQEQRAWATTAAAVAGDWTAAAETLADVPVSPVVRVQVLVNRVRQFRTDRLAALRKRLEHVDKRLADTMRKERRARMAYKFEQSQVIAAMMRFTENYKNYTPVKTATVATDTDAYITEDSKSSESYIGTVKLGDSDDEVQQISASEQNVDGLSAQLKSLYETVCELTTYLIGVTIHLKNTLTSEKYKRRTIMACQIVRYVFSKFKSRHFRYVAQTVVDIFEKLIEIEINVNLIAEETSIIVKLFPEVENI